MSDADAIELVPARRTLATVGILLGTLMATLDSSIVNVALPQLSRDLHSSPSDVVWVATSYLLAVACAIPLATGVAQRIGMKRTILIGLPLFTVASLACALSPSLGWLVTARVVQGASSALVFAVSIPLYRRLFSPARLGSILGVNAMTVAVGLSAGPALGGLILGGLSWPWLFLINVPLGLVATLLTGVFLPRAVPAGGRFDIVGALLAAAALAGFLLGIHELANVKTLWVAALLLFACASLVTLFIRTERRSARPVIPLALFTGRFTLALLTATASFFGQGVAFVALPFLFQTAYHASPLQSALLLTPWPLVIVIAAPVMGRVADRRPGSPLAVVGLAIFTLGLLSLALLGGHPPIWQVLVSTFVAGLGFAVFQSPNNRDMMSAAPMAYATSAAGVLNINRTTAQSAGAGAVSMALVIGGASTGSLASQAGAANSALLVAVIGGAVAVAVSVVKQRGIARTRSAPM